MASRAAASAAKDTLTKAILGFQGATAGVKEHEDLNSHLERIKSDFLRGRKAGADDSPGRREAGLAAHEREIPMERGHEGGGNVLSNETHGFGKEFARDPDRPGEIATSNNGEARSMTHAAGVMSAGHLKSALPSGGYPEQAPSFRSIAAKASAGEKLSGGNAKSVRPAPAAREPGRVGGAPAPAKAGPDTNQPANGYEQVPKYVAKERAGKDQYERAAEGVRKLLRAPKR